MVLRRNLYGTANVKIAILDVLYPSRAFKTGMTCKYGSYSHKVVIYITLFQLLTQSLLLVMLQVVLAAIRTKRSVAILLFIWIKLVLVFSHGKL